MLFDIFGWRFFQFRFCSSPQGIQIVELTVQDNICHIKAESSVVGSFSYPHYNGTIYTYHDGVLKVGIHEGSINAYDKVNEYFKVDGEIIKIILCGNGMERELDFRQS